MESDGTQEHSEPDQEFSLAERDRRWTIVRGLMSDAGIDILLAVTEPDSQYLSQLTDGVGPTILPLSGQATTLLERAKVGPRTSPWVHDIRPRHRAWKDGIIERLAELDVDRTIIGVVGLDGSLDWPDGNLNYGTFIGLREAFPHARWVGATTLVQEARYRKSLEEIRVLEIAAQAADAGLLAAAQRLSQGTPARGLLGYVLLAVAQANAQPGSRTRLRVLGAAAPSPAAARPLGDGRQGCQILQAQVEARVRGYGARGAQPAVIGPVPPDWREASRVAAEAWERAIARLCPGASLETVLQHAKAATRAPYQLSFRARGAGLGGDLPVASPGSRVGGRTLEEGACFALMARVAWGDPSTEQTLTWGDTVAITGSGSRRLGSRRLEILAF